MSAILEIITIKIFILAGITSLLQNIFVDIFKCGNTHFENVGFKSGNPKILERILLVVSSIIIFILLYVSELATFQEIILICLVSTILAWIMYKTNIYTQLMDIIIALKNGIINIIKKKLGA